MRFAELSFISLILSLTDRMSTNGLEQLISLVLLSSRGQLAVSFDIFTLSMRFEGGTSQSVVSQDLEPCLAIIYSEDEEEIPNSWSSFSSSLGK